MATAAGLIRLSSVRTTDCIEAMKNNRKQGIFLILMITLLVDSGFGQKVQVLDCTKKYSHCDVSEYTKIIDANPSDTIAFFNRGMSLYQQKRLDESISDLSRVIQIDQKFEGIYAFRGVVFLLKKNYELAIADYNRAIELEPAKASHYYSRGVAYSNRNEIDKAVTNYAKAVELDPRDLLYHDTRGWIYYHNGKKSLAEADFKVAKDLEKLEENADLVKLIHSTYPSLRTWGP
jgi:tetratricopeptide (TPR) repeat protein